MQQIKNGLKCKNLGNWNKFLKISIYCYQNIRIFALPLQILNMRQLTIQTFTYYLIYSGARKAFRKIMYRKKFYFSCSKEMYHFEEIP